MSLLMVRLMQKIKKPQTKTMMLLKAEILCIKYINTRTMFIYRVGR